MNPSDPPLAKQAADYYTQLLRPVFSGRKFLLAGPIAVALGGLAQRLVRLGAQRPFLLAGSEGTGPIPSPEQAELRVLGLQGADVLSEHRRLQRASRVRTGIARARDGSPRTARSTLSGTARNTAKHDREKSHMPGFNTDRGPLGGLCVSRCVPSGSNPDHPPLAMSPGPSASRTGCSVRIAGHWKRSPTSGRERALRRVGSSSPAPPPPGIELAPNLGMPFAADGVVRMAPHRDDRKRGDHG